MIFNQSDFSGGENFFTSDLNIPQNGYYYLINARQRLGHVEANCKSLEITLPPSNPGKLQGHIGLGDILIEFIDGKAWYQVSGTNDWIVIPGINLDATVDKIWSCAVPASTFNLTRKLNPSGNANDPILRGKYFAVNGTDAGVVVQDTINQPCIIYEDITSGTLVARTLGTYPKDVNNPQKGDWTPTNPEYVPIGGQMMFVETKLYIVSVDGSQLYQSVSGMPLNFVINIDINGNAAGDASTTFIAFDNDEITCVVPTSTQDSFIYGTTRNSRIVSFNFVNTIFGEPTYSTTIIPVGPVNQDCVLDILGDTAIMDSEGVKSFNGVQQQKWRGNNSIFSISLSRLLTVVTGGTTFIKQTRCRCISFNNFGIFALDTKFGYLFAIYDMLTSNWVALDIIQNIVGVIQFAIVETLNANYLYVQTENNQVFQLYSDAKNREMASLHTRVFAKVRPQVVADAYQANPQLMVEQKSERINLLFQDGSTNTNVTVQEFTDGKFTQRRTQLLESNLAGVGPGPIFPPVIPSTKVRSQPMQFNLTADSKDGTKLAYIIQWNSDAKLQALELITADKIPAMSNKQTDQMLDAAGLASTSTFPNN